MRKRSFISGMLAALTLCAQGPAPNRPLAAGDQPDIQTLVRTVQALRRTASLGAAAGSQADKLLEEATALLQNAQTGEARRKVAHAQALITGKTWDAKEEFLWSLALRPQRFVVEQSRPMMIDVSQVYSASYRPAGGLRLRLALKTAERESKPFRQVGLFEVPARDLVADPFRFQADLTGIPDASYQLTAELLEGESPLISLQQTIGVAEGIETRYTDVERRLAKIAGNESAKATVRWPFDIARVVNIGIRKLGTTDFGLPETGTQTFDFAKELRESGEVLNRSSAWL
jgi:hypothetical protein